ncbi:Uncharacterized conserved protein [Anoxybacillus flavithermus WK1]|uniref:Uncharacterized conserved protein n=1 Tax=Anoxybacillus flavithermus (strain DSM 21510 / WK1) TaxID=491915 RepID=B7GL93_ANOFW|nr:Uncharacterized conserved protein [Anoxybacillus flavithermus WK1]
MNNGNFLCYDNKKWKGLSNVKIRKTMIDSPSLQQNVYIYENKKEQYIVVAIPYLEWSIHVTYDDLANIELRLQQSLANVLDEEHVLPLAMKLAQWMREM